MPDSQITLEALAKELAKVKAEQVESNAKLSKLEDDLRNFKEEHYLKENKR